MNNIIKSPIIYMGNKYRLIEKLFDWMPRDINSFYDLFGGSGTVSINAQRIATRVHYNELNGNIFKMFNALVEKQDIIAYIKKMEKEFGLKKLKKSEEENTELGLEYKGRFDAFREHVNNKTVKNPLDYYTLMSYAFNGLIRFSQSNNYNAPFGYTERDGSALNKWISKVYETDMDLIVTNDSFENVIDLNEVASDDYVYVDPPYMNTTAVYNENRLTGWNMENEETLFNMLEQLDKKGVKWGMSNIFGNSEVDNFHLREWCATNGWFVKHIKVSYANFGQKDKKNEEVFITNYDTNNYQNQFELDI